MLIRLIHWWVRRHLARRGPARWIHLRGNLYIERYIMRGGHDQDGSRINVWLHRLHQPDDDRGPHNHPHEWNASLILTGGYRELRPVAFGRAFSFDRAGRTTLQPDGEVVTTYVEKTYGPGQLNILRPGQFHRISELCPGETWTLFVSGPKHGRGWGFLVNGLFQRKSAVGGCQGCPAGTQKCENA